MFYGQLWIRVRAMEILLDSARLNGGSSALLHWWSENTEVSSLLWIDRLSSVACCVRVLTKSAFGVVSSLSYFCEGFPVDLVISSG
jgi:hypothetical protein